ncbi:TerB family tellurite resistance protein [Alteromonas aestuariivivens]|uniref:TerB family tellurite resistance protein n=1 Tax=Alteromonas aestuariivivens TaxID=1938339 RepID=A0A3D8M6C2_9ALTE|nr:TerB family tellurite resistance protein [Alteromonas aestuariivivens]RDV25229.1 TerB family tellurite resistance protein [Alteromonas aestuariivivens]
MLKAVLELFRKSAASATPGTSVELATAVLLSEIIRADHHADERELETYRTMLTSHFDLSDEALCALMDDGLQSSDEAVDLVQFTKVINAQCDSGEKQKILKSLWQIAFADSTIAPIEEHVIRRISELLYLPHSQFIKAKLEVTGE